MSIKPEERIYDAAKKQHYFVWAISDHVSNVEPIFNRTMDYVSELETENAELRELIWTLANCAAGHGCDYCPINGGYGYVGELDMCESVHARMCELKVEMDG